MSERQTRPLSFHARFLIIATVGAVIIVCLERWSQGLLVRSQHENGLPAAYGPVVGAANVYLSARSHFLENFVLYSALLLIAPPFAYHLLRRLARASNHWRERFVGMTFKQTSYHLPSPFAHASSPIEAAQTAFIDELFDNPNSADQVLLGFDGGAQPVYLTDRARSMHVHVLGQTGSGKTQSVIYPLLYQDARRLWRNPASGEMERRPLLFLDAKGAAENEATVAAIAAATGRLEHLRIFSLNPGRPTHTYNPIYLPPGGDPRQIAERVFATFESDLDVQYYKDMARELWVNLVSAIASTGKQTTMLDLAAAIADPEIMAHALSLASDQKAVRAIRSRYRQLGDRQGMTYTGLLAAVNRYDHPALNTYDPDIVLDELLEHSGIAAFSLSANAYKFQARAVGLIVLQHIQHIGALRQMDRQRNQAPLYVYADEFYTFAYEGFIDAVNKLRDANISMLLSHQSPADLDRVSHEYAVAVWDNTRNKIVLYQNDAEICERLANAVGTRKNIELTIRRNVDGWLNQASALEASSREVDEFILHPNHLKALRPGQAYLVQAGTTEAPPRSRWPWARKRESPAGSSIGINLALFKQLPVADPVPPRAAGDTPGIGLHQLFLENRVGRG